MDKYYEMFGHSAYTHFMAANNAHNYYTQDHTTEALLKKSYQDPTLKVGAKNKKPNDHAVEGIKTKPDKRCLEATISHPEIVLEKTYVVMKSRAFFENISEIKILSNFDPTHDQLGRYPDEPKRIFVEKHFATADIAATFFKTYQKRTVWNGFSITVQLNEASVFKENLNHVAVPKRGRPKKTLSN